MRIDRLASSGPTFSFEFFPPKDLSRLGGGEGGELRLLECDEATGEL